MKQEERSDSGVRNLDCMGSVPDCLAVCSPGAIIAIPLLVERIVLSPKDNPQTEADVHLVTDEVYDLLIRAESKEVSTLLFLSPHVLFDLDDPEASLVQHVHFHPILGGEIPNWHYPVEPRMEGDELEVFFHNLTDMPANQPLESLRGTVGVATIEFPEVLRDRKMREVLHGLERTVFQCRVDPPIPVGKQRWLRVRVTPSRLTSVDASPTMSEPSENSAIVRFSQMLDILGADTLRMSFRDHLRNLIARNGPHRGGKEAITEADIVVMTRLYNCIFANGFDHLGTFTAIEEQRIILIPQRCRMTAPTHEDGSISFKGISPIVIGGSRAGGFSWVAGTRNFPEHDPKQCIDEVIQYLKSGSHSPEAAKSITEISLSQSFEPSLVTEILEELLRRGAVRKLADGKFYFYSDSMLPDEERLRLKWRNEVISSIAERFVVIQAHFRVYYQVHWEQTIAVRTEKLRRERALVVLFRYIAVIGLAISITMAVVKIIENYSK